MARSLSVDFRRRVVGAIEDGLSCRAAAERFGVSASSAIRWRAMERREGDLRPKRQGGDRHSHRIEAHAEVILSAVAAKSDITLSELRGQLKERGVAVAIDTLWRFFKRRNHAQKKTAPAAEQRRSAVNAGHARRGLKDNSTSIRPASSSSTRPPPTPRWRAFTVVRPGASQGASNVAPPCPMATGKPPPSPPGCVTTASLRPWSSKAQ
jgi:transposase